ncbi:MAG: family 10 glycosylhydrolase [Microcystaceae cyanobacterium]
MKKISLALLFAISFNLPFFAAIAQAQLTSYCQLPLEAIAVKDQLRNAAFKGKEKQKKAYRNLITKHAFILRECRRTTWPQEQAIWLRVYPCDLRPGVLDTLLDQIVNNGYSRIYVEVFFNSQVLLPKADNPTVWPSIVRDKKWEKADLFAQVIKKGRERGLKVYAWMFTMNFGFAYSQNPDRQWVLAKNGFGQNSTEVVADQIQAFIDPYNPQAQSDYQKMLQAVLKRRPDGVLFDYIRYPRGVAGQTTVGKVKDLWVYGDASYQALINRGMNQKGRFLIQQYLDQGYITVTDIANADRQFKGEGSPLWVGRNAPRGENQQTPPQKKARLDQDLWNLALAHAANGVIDFLTRSANQVKKQGSAAGAVFFPDANQGVGDRGYDARLQAWERFPRFMEWHPMAYAVCNTPKCIVSQIKRVTRIAQNKTVVTPAIAGVWGVSQPNRPSLQSQMRAIQQGNPTIQAVSHFAYSWQDPDFDRQRRDCRF